MPEVESIVLPRWVCLSTCSLVDATLVNDHNTLPEWLRFPALLGLPLRMRLVREDELPLEHLAKRGHQLLQGTVLEQIARGPGLLRFDEILWVLGDGQDQDFGRRVGLANEAGGGQAIHDGHPEIHEDEVRLQLVAERDGFLAIARLAHDHQIWFATEQQTQAGPSQLMIINDEQPSREGTGDCWGLLHRGRLPLAVTAAVAPIDSDGCERG